MQIELDEEKEIGSLLMFSASGDTHEMYVALIRYKDRRYISLSRMNRHKSKKTGEEKLTHRNSIWIPISDGKKIGELIYRAAMEAVRLGWDDIYDEDKSGRDVATLEEGEKVFRYSVNICRDAKIFLSVAQDSLEEALGLRVKIPTVAKKLSFTLPQIIRVIDYLEDAGFIKQVRFFDIDTITYSEQFFDILSDTLKILSEPTFQEKIRQRAMQLSKFSQVQVEELDYMDDDDPHLIYWNFCLRFAESEVLKILVKNKVPVSFEITAKGYDWLND